MNNTGAVQCAAITALQYSTVMHAYLYRATQQGRLLSCTPTPGLHVVELLLLQYTT